jgi:hypothetical protein
METLDWHRCRFLESIENLKPLIKKRFGRQPSTSIAQEITACLQQGRLFYEAAASSPLEIRPLQLFYGMVGFSKALVVARHLKSLSTLRPAHGLKDISPRNCRIEDLRLTITDDGTFHEFNNVVAELNRLCYIDSSTNWRVISLPSAKSETLRGVDLSLREIVSRIHGLESLYRMTFGEDAATAEFLLESDFGDEEAFRIRIDDSQVFNDLESLKQIVSRWRSMFPFLKMWRWHSADRAWGRSILYFRNTRKSGIDEFSRFVYQEGAYIGPFEADGAIERFPLVDGFQPVGGGYSGSTYAISPVKNDLFISEFSFHFMALFLLSCLARYRPQAWTQSISRSIIGEVPPDDKALSLIERFLDINRSLIPQLVVKVLNPYEDPQGSAL